MNMQKEKASLTKKKATTSKSQKKALGKGLGALIPDIDTLDNQPNEFFWCDTQQIEANPYQPRKLFTEEALKELSRSIKAQGILQPLIVRPAEMGYQLVTGERRLRAAKMAGLKRVPVLIKTLSDGEMLELSIVENIQRANLNPVEEAEAYQRLMSEFELTQDEIAQKVGKSRSAVANFLRLKQLPQPVIESIRQGQLSMGHAKALMGADNKAQLITAWQKVITQHLSVRGTEQLIKRLKKEAQQPSESSLDPQQTYILGLADNLSRHFGTRVHIRKRGQKGKIEIEFLSSEDLDQLLNRLMTH
jgi:ParB family chromosome partitioning protein